MPATSPVFTKQRLVQLSPVHTIGLDLVKELHKREKRRYRRDRGEGENEEEREKGEERK